MEGQGKRLLLAVALALGVMLIWQKFISPPPADDKPKPTATAPGTPGSGPLVVPGSTVGESIAPTPVDANAQSELPRAAEQNITLTFPNRFAATFSSWTGGLSSWKLADPRFERDQTKGELLPSPLLTR